MRLAATLVLISLTVVPGAAQLQAHTEGTVHFPTSCAKAVQPRFDHAIALLHSFAFSQAGTELHAILAADPGCAMAHWALALGAWGNPFAPGVRGPAQLGAGMTEIRAARGAGRPTVRERGYIEAAAQLYENAAGRSQPERLAGYRDAMTALAAAQPADTEAQIFHALALDIASDPTDKSYRSQLAAAAILEPLFRALPDHPGLAHYLIHTYDVPALAARGIPAAAQYSEIAPEVSHALHMPSHVFTRVGMWQESIEANTAARARAHAEGSIAEELHAMDYQAYAYLQLGRDSEVAALMAALPALAAQLDPNLQTTGAPPAAGYFALAAIPARYALERGAWREAAELPPSRSPILWSNAPNAIARALGAARAGDTALAIAALADLQRLEDTLTARHEGYWAGQVAIGRVSASAWLVLAQGNRALALARMDSAAVMEEATEKSVVTPGPLAPARELQGEMLLALGDSAGAAAAFRRSLEHDPGRRRSVEGERQTVGR